MCIRDSNHSADQYPDLTFATVDGRPAPELVDEAWLDDYFVPTVAKRGAAIIEARGASSAASAASAAIDHMHTWALGTPEGDWSTFAGPSHGEYGVPEGLIYGMPVICKDGQYQVVEGLELPEKTKQHIVANAKAAEEEIATVKELGIL